METNRSIKDKTNILSINLWSGGELNNSVSSQEITLTGYSATVSKENAINGDKSLELTKTTTSSDYIRIPFEIPGGNSKIHSEFNIHTPNCNCGIYILQYNESNTLINNYAFVSVPQSNKNTLIIVESDLEAECNHGKIQIRHTTPSQGTSVWIDNLQCYIQ